MTNYPVRITVQLGDEFVTDALDAAGYGIAYWAESLDIPREGFVRITPDAEARESGYRARTFTYGRIAEALAKVAAGGIARSDLTDHARRAILDSDAGEIDSELSDVIVQVAMFGKIVFG